MTFRTMLERLALCCAALLLVISTSQAGTLYGSTGDSKFFQIDPANGDITDINTATDRTIVSLAYDPFNDTMYGSNDGNKFFSIDPATGDYHRHQYEHEQKHQRPGGQPDYRRDVRGHRREQVLRNRPRDRQHHQYQYQHVARHRHADVRFVGHSLRRHGQHPVLHDRPG